MNIGRTLLLTAALLGASLGTARFDRGSRTNPPAQSELVVPPVVASPLHRACFDCHSNETSWPWYGEFYPISILIESEVARARQELNFSEWGRYSPKMKLRKLQWAQRVLTEKTMPPLKYRILHPRAGLSTEETAVVAQWIHEEIGTLSEQLKTLVN